MPDAGAATSRRPLSRPRRDPTPSGSRHAANERYGWAVVGSAWLHIILAILFWFSPKADREAPAVMVVERIVEVPPAPETREDPLAPEEQTSEEAPRAAQQRTTDQNGGGAGSSAGRSGGNGSIAAGRAHRQGSGSGSAEITATDERLAADRSAPDEVPEGSPLPTRPNLPPLAQAAIAQPKSAAKAPKPRDDAPVPQPPTPQDRAAPPPPAPARDEEEAVAEIDPPEDAPAPVPEEEEPPPPEPEQEEEVQEFARAPGEDEGIDVRSDVISSVSRGATARSRTQVTSPELAPVPSPIEAPTTADAKASRQIAGGGGNAPSGTRAEQPEKVEQNRQTSAMAGHRGKQGVTAGSAGPTGEQRDTAGAASRAEAAVAAASHGNAGAAEPLPSAPDGEEVPAAAGSPAPEWWQPIATRVELAEPTAAETSPRLPTTGVARAPVRTEVPEIALGGAGEQADEQAEPAPGVEAKEVVVLETAEDVPVVRASVEPVDELREALGWGKLDRSTLQPKIGTLGNEASSGLPPGSPQTVTKEDPLAGVVFVAVKGTPLGKYTEEVYAILEQRWFALDLDAHQKALGIQGDVGVVFRISRSGRVYDIDVTRSSGNRELDRMAISAIPERLPRVPSDVESATVVQHITFHYRNPWLVSSAGMP